MVFDVIGFGLISTTFLITFAKYFTRNWFPYFMVGLVAFEVGMFTLTKCKTIEPERAPTRSESSEGSSRAPPSSLAKSKGNQSPSRSQSPSKGQAAINKQDKAAKKAQAKATAAAAK